MMGRSHMRFIAMCGRHSPQSSSEVEDLSRSVSPSPTTDPTWPNERSFLVRMTLVEQTDRSCSLGKGMTDIENFTGKVALVTGSGQGMGRAIATVLARREATSPSMTSTPGMP